MGNPVKEKCYLPKWLVGPGKKPDGIEAVSYGRGCIPGGKVADNSGGLGITVADGKMCEGGRCISAVGVGADFVKFGAVDDFSGFSFFWWWRISQAIRTCIAFHRPGFCRIQMNCLNSLQIPLRLNTECVVLILEWNEMICSGFISNLLENGCQRVEPNQKQTRIKNSNRRIKWDVARVADIMEAPTTCLGLVGSLAGCVWGC